MPSIFQGNNIKTRNLKEQTVKEEYIETLKTKLPKDQIQDVETERKTIKGSFSEAAGKAVKRS